MNLAPADLLARIDRCVERNRRYEHELALLGGRTALTRFAEGGIHQNLDVLRVVAQARVALPAGGGARVAATRSTDLSETGLRALLDRALELARTAPIDGAFRDMLAAGYHASSLTSGGTPRDARTADTGPAFRAHEIARAVVPHGRGGRLRLSGHYRIDEGEPGDHGDAGLIALANQWDIRGAHVGTVAEFCCTAETADGTTGWAAAWSRTRDGIDPVAVAAKAVERARRSEAPVGLQRGRYRVLLDPAAVATLLAFALPAFSQRAVREGRSAIRGSARPHLLANPYSLIADPLHPDLLLRSFDGEGVPSQPVTLVDHGVQRELVTGRRDEPDEARVNGYGPLQPSAADALPRGVRLEGGHGTPEELDARTRDAIVIGRLWYVRAVDSVQGIVTGTTRDGFWERKNGEQTRALRHARFTVNVFDLLRNIVDASAPVRVGGHLVPAVVVDGMALEGSE